MNDGTVQHLYKVTAEKCVIVIGNLPSATELDRIAMGRLPMHEHLIFEEVFSLVEGFTADVQGYLRPKRDRQESCSLYYVQMTWNPIARELDSLWSGAVEALKSFKAGTVLGLYRVAGMQLVIAVVDVEDAESLNMLVNIPELHSPVFEKVWALRDYHLFADDVRKNYNI